MNTPDVIDAVTIKYGPLKLVLAQKILREALEYAVFVEISVEKLVMSEYDVVGAFGQNKICPEDAPLLSIRLTDELVMIHMFGQFGPLGQPEVCMRLRVKALVNTYLEEYIL